MSDTSPVRWAELRPDDFRARLDEAYDQLWRHHAWIRNFYRAKVMGATLAHSK
ncbi:MAG: hypothetical protein H7Y06_12560 [Opitutaceae bacterium]|nr:hypothetical protein [Opitutaceae bacterium]